MISKFILKPAAIFTLFFFVGFCLSSSLAIANENNPVTSEEKSQGESTSIEKTETMPGVAEVESPDSDGPVIKAKKKFPWLLVGVGVVAVGVLAFLLMGKKKEQTLTVNLGAGTTGTPGATGKYKKGEAVSYNYTPQAGYNTLQVKLDGVVVAASGTVNMDRDHILDVSSTQQFTLTVSLGTGTTGTPAATATYSKDQVVNYIYNVQTGYSNLQVKLDGVAVTGSGTVTMNTNHTLDVSAVKGYILMVNGVRYDMVSIPSGTFLMGNYPLWDEDETPIHRVTISRVFWFGKTEVTQGLWKAVMGSNPSYRKAGDNYPVENVSWDECQAFIKKLNQIVGVNIFRLPTEAEWEYSCRAGTTGNHYGDPDVISWHYLNSGYSTHPVGLKQANAFGLFDMSGNVSEWCQDRYDPKYYEVSPPTDPIGPSLGDRRVSRGGTFATYPIDTRSSNRSKDYPGQYEKFTGFRLAATSTVN